MLCLLLCQLHLRDQLFVFRFQAVQGSQALRLCLERLDFVVPAFEGCFQGHVRPLQVREGLLNHLAGFGSVRTEGLQSLLQAFALFAL